MKKTLLMLSLCAAFSASAQTITPDFIAEEATQTYYQQNFDSPEEAATWEYNVINKAFTWHLMEQLNDGPTFATVDPQSRYSLGIKWSNSYARELAVSPEITVKPNSRVDFWCYFQPDYINYGYFRLKILTPTDTVMVFNQLDWYKEKMFEQAHWEKISVDLSTYSNKTIRLGLLYDGMGGESHLVDGIKVVQKDYSSSAHVAICEGETVHFRDQSLGFPNKWQWEFEGGEPATSNVSSPSVKYNKAGIYRVKLTASNYDDAKTVEREAFVEVGKHSTVARIGLPSGGNYSPNVERFIPVGTTMTFTDRSPVDVLSREWTLPGTDVATSADENPKVKYTQQGTFDVKLHINNSEGESEDVLEQVIQAGGEQYIWNISSEERPLIAANNYGFDMGFYGGNNTFMQDKFAEYYAYPGKTAYINKVNVYFGSAEVVSNEAEIKLAIVKSNSGTPGEEMATSRVKAGEINTNIGEPTEFLFDDFVEINSDFFITIGNFPSGSNGSKQDKIAVALVRRSPGERTTTYYYQSKQDEDGNFYPYTWYQANENASSFAIAPLVVFDQPTGIASVNSHSEEMQDAVYTIDGKRLNIYKEAQGLIINNGKKIIKR